MNKKEYHIWYNKIHKISINKNRKIWYRKHKKAVHEYNIIYNKVHKKEIDDKYQKNKKVILKYHKKRYLKDRLKILKRTNAYNRGHKEETRIRMISYRQKHKKQRYDYNKKWKKDNSGLVSISNLKFHYLRKQRIRKNLSQKEIEAIKQFYIHCPKGYQVDHIVPLLGKETKGWHELKNLQYLTAKENMSKGSKFPYYTLEFYIKKQLIQGVIYGKVWKI